MDYGQAGPRPSRASYAPRVGGFGSWRANWRSSARPRSSSARTSRTQRLYPVIDRLVDAGAPVDRCCRIFGVARQNYYKHKLTPATPRQLRRQWLTGLIREVHVASRGTYGYRRIHAELTLAMSVRVCSRTVSVLMTQAGNYGLPGPTRVKRLHGAATADDLGQPQVSPVAPK